MHISTWCDLEKKAGAKALSQGNGCTRSTSEIRNELERRLNEGHADEVLTLGEELLRCGTRQVEESLDATEIQMGVAHCMPVIVQALDQSSLTPTARLAWAMDAVLKDKYGLCEPFAEYLYGKHPKTAWDALADQLLTRLRSSKPVKGANHFSRNYAREQLTDWTIHALERAGRTEEIIPLCEAEAKATGSFERLVARLMAARRDEEAERWIREGIRLSPKERYPGNATLPS